MFHFRKKNKELEALAQKVRLEAENNYKDTATEAYRKFCGRLEELEREGSVRGKMLEFYHGQKEELGEMMKGFHH
ncbi:MAG TPA: hypothetical protein IAA57_12460 [Candidatus Pullilachnospira intestinigallinarum]|nr:hypothetical protein [Candidatus Pullilachnospira intestinigallinarum]